MVGVIAVNLLSIIPIKSPMALDIMMIGYLFQGMSCILCGSYLVSLSLGETLHVKSYHSPPDEIALSHICIWIWT